MIDTQKIVDAIIASGVGPLAVEQGASLLDKWIDVCYEEDLKRKVVAVETGFVCFIDDATAIIGVQDLLTEEDGIIVGGEHKSTKERTKFWNENSWLDSISEGSQLGVYALALKEGTYYERATGKEFKPNTPLSYIRVRAASKSNPPDIWPHDPLRSLVHIKPERIARVRQSLLVKAASVRAMKRSGEGAWQLPGIWCVNQFRKTCQFHDDCLTGNVPPSGAVKFDSSDPAAQLSLAHIGDRINNPDLVLLSASQYSTVSECAEKYRRINLVDGHTKDGDRALDVGSAMHAGLAAYYEQLRDIQQKNLVIV